MTLKKMAKNTESTLIRQERIKSFGIPSWCRVAHIAKKNKNKISETWQLFQSSLTSTFTEGPNNPLAEVS